MIMSRLILNPPFFHPKSIIILWCTFISSKESNSGTQPTLRFGQTTNPKKAASIEKPSKHRKRVVIRDDDDDDSDNE